ncbi:lysylphosphatidylglycerol synthase transmembrane domain-containing protein [uncultured Ilyobacter sp.]|uniref:lysylphosphatidylglycerol synthase transmembrane domain-containing protein n=1 Tax=uncultured Ilyobacter sp. TaxID=544433 RepID=UPI0029F596ED|nr:lysylphosphatidylglycerol synthase transmembrane domain-containing protein [uncultured Ilyobacter sp.]
MKKTPDNIKNKILETHEKIEIGKKWTYFFLAFVFILTSFLSLIFVYHIASSKESFFTLEIFPVKMFFQIGGLLFIYFTLDGLRLYYILKALNIKIDFRYILRLVFINIFVSNITPFATGGGFLQVFFLKKKGVAMGSAIAATIIRTVLPIIFFFATTPFIFLFDRDLINMFSRKNSLFIVIFLFTAYVAAVFTLYRIFYNSKTIKRFICKFLNYFGNKNIITANKVKNLRAYFFKEVDNFRGSVILFLKGDKKNVILAIIFTLMFLFSLFMFPVLIIKGLNYDISIFSIIAAQIIITAITYFAPTPGATGIAEGGFSLIFSQFVQKKDIVSVTFAWRFFTIYTGFIIGLIIFYRELIKNNDKNEYKQ